MQRQRIRTLINVTFRGCYGLLRGGVCFAPPGMEDVLMREQYRMRRLAELAAFTPQPARSFAECFDCWLRQTPFSWVKGFAIIHERLMHGQPPPWWVGCQGP